MGLKKTKIIADAVILICSGGMALSLYIFRPEWSWLTGVFIISLILMAGSVVDIVIQSKKKEGLRESQTLRREIGVNYLILLDEQDKPIKQWEIAGRTSAVIGRRNEDHEEEIDIDLGECEYSAFIDPCHAVLNFCLDSWYIEDLGSQNGVQVRKVEDGVCYKVLNRPCKISAGDILYIANTRLLLT